MEMRAMNKYEFLSRLRNALSALPKEEREAAMSYYEEFFSDAGEENEQAVIASLGAPEELARSIMNENAVNNGVKENSGAVEAAVNTLSVAETENGENTETDSGANFASGFDPSSNSGGGFNPPPTPAAYAKSWSGGQIALFVILAVLSSPIWLSVIAALVTVIASVLAVMIGLFVGFAAGSVGFFTYGIITLFSDAVTGVFLLGVSLILGGLIPLAIYPLSKVLIKLFIACGKGIAALFRRLTGGKEMR